MSEVDAFRMRTTAILRQCGDEIRDLRALLAVERASRADRIDGTGAVDGSRGAARMLEVAARNADKLLDEARTEAASILATARDEADRLGAISYADAYQLTASARAEADQVLVAARTEADGMLAELEQTRSEQSAELDQHRSAVLAERQAAVEAEVTRLQKLEHDHRDQMPAYLTYQLAQIEPTPASGGDPVAGRDPGDPDTAPRHRPASSI